MSLVDHPYLGPPLLTGARRGGLSQELAATHAEELEAARSRAADLERLLQAASPRIGGVSRAEMLAEMDQLQATLAELVHERAREQVRAPLANYYNREHPA